MYWKINKLQTQHATLEAAVTKGDATLIEILQKVRLIFLRFHITNEFFNN